MTESEVVLHNRYVPVELIRKTSSAQVLLCRDAKAQAGTIHPFVAVKVMRRDLSLQGEQEFSMLTGLQDKGGQAHVVSPVEIFSYQGHTCIAMELMGKCLHDVSRACILPSNAIRGISHKLMQDVAFLHSLNILHADIKPGNIAFDITQSTVKLLDFGNAMNICDVFLYFDLFEVQTMRYRAPEVFFGCEFGTQIDIWSVALTLLELCAGRPVFSSTTTTDLAEEWRHFFGADFDLTPFQEGKLFFERAPPCFLASLEKENLKQEFQCGNHNATTAQGNVEFRKSSLSQHSLEWDCPSNEDEEKQREDDVVAQDASHTHTGQSVKKFLLATNPSLANSSSCIDFFTRLLRVDPLKRMGISEALAHDFLSTHMLTR